MASSPRALLLRLDQALERTKGPLEVPQAAIEWAVQATGAFYGGLLLLEEGRASRLVTPSREGRPVEAADEPLHCALRIALSSWTRQRWTELLIPDTQTAPEWANVRELGPVRGILAVPLLDTAALRGLVLLTRLQAGRFTPWQSELLQAAAPRILAAMSLRSRGIHPIRDPAHLTAIMNSLTEPLLALDAAGRVILANPPLERLLGRPAGELLGQDFHQAVPLQHPSQPDMIAQVLRGGCASFNLDMVLRSAEGENIPVRVGCGAIPGPDGTPNGAAIILHDIRYLREVEGLREDLSNMLIHDLKGPLAAVASTIQLLQQYSPAKMGEATLQELLAIADQGARRLSRLIEAVLDVHQLEAGQFPLKVEAVNLSALAVEVLAEVAPLAAASEIRTGLDIPHNLPDVAGDAAVLARVLWNLLDNALKYTPKGGQVLVQARRADGPGRAPETTARSAATGRQWVAVHISDTGIGIPPEEQERIFGKFAQGGRRPLRRRGIGLGLAFCRLAVESHGGQIWVTSNREGGSVFSFTLPVFRPGDDNPPAKG